jgi:hypothetical protein
MRMVASTDVPHNAAGETLAYIRCIVFGYDIREEQHQQLRDANSTRRMYPNHPWFNNEHPSLGALSITAFYQ